VRRGNFWYPSVVGEGFGPVNGAKKVEVSDKQKLRNAGIYAICTEVVANNLGT
jgi:hypothetical protein